MGYVGTDFPKRVARDVYDYLMIAGIVAVLIAFLGICPAWAWYQAGIQRDVWARSGCQMTQWEVFMGAKPLDRNLVVPNQVER